MVEGRGALATLAARMRYRSADEVEGGGAGLRHDELGGHGDGFGHQQLNSIGSFDITIPS
jgi:hypothetical protein